MRVWVLSQFYQCPEFDWPWPVCSSYGDSPCCSWHPPDPVTSGAWSLIRLSTSPQHIQAMKLDPRVQYVGGDYAIPPQQVYDIFGKWLDAGVTYPSMGALIEKLCEWEQAFHAVDDNYSK